MTEREAPVDKLVMATQVVHCKRSRYDVYIGRPSKWGNPFVVGHDGTRGEVIAKFRAHLLAQPDLVEACHRELRGKVLGCWCAPRACHGDVLAEVADGVFQLPLPLAK